MKLVSDSLTIRNEFEPTGRRLSPLLRSGDGLRPFLRLFYSVELADQRIDAASELGEKGDFVAGSAVAFRHQDSVDQDGNDEAFGVIDLLQAAQLRQCLVTGRNRISHRLGTTDKPRHSFTSASALRIRFIRSGESSSRRSNNPSRRS